MRIIIDTHLLIFREYNSSIPDKYHKLLSCFNKSNLQIFVHPMSLRELENDRNLKNRAAILSKATTYLQIDNPPNAKFDHDFQSILKMTDDLSDQIDNQLLYCVYKNHVDYLITEDKDIHLKSKLLKIADQILTVEKAIDLLDTDQTFGSTKPSIPRRPKPEYSFYKNGDFWLIGEKGNERQLKDLLGLRFISFLLQYPNQYFSSIKVFNEGKFQNGDATNYEEGLNDAGGILELNIGGSHIPKAKIKLLIKNMEAKIEENYFNDPNELTKIKSQLKVLKKYSGHKGQRDYKSESEKARVNIYRRIKLALEKIHYMVPELALYLNDSTIKCGDSFSYSPIVGQEPTWILTPKDPKRIPT